MDNGQNALGNSVSIEIMSCKKYKNIKIIKFSKMYVDFAIIYKLFEIINNHKIINDNNL